MEVSFKFTNGETGGEIVAAILNLFGNSGVSAPQQIAPQDAPDAGKDEEPAGTPTSATHDTTGLAYDERIHSKPPAMTDKGVWRKKRGVADTLVASVTAELRATKPAPSMPLPGAAPAAGALPLPGAGSLPLPPVVTPFTELVDFLAKQMQSAANPTGRLTEAYVTDCLKLWGIVDAAGNGSLQALQTAPPERIATVRATFAQALGIAA